MPRHFWLILYSGLLAVLPVQQPVRPLVCAHHPRGRPHGLSSCQGVYRPVHPVSRAQLILYACTVPPPDALRFVVSYRHGDS